MADAEPLLPPHEKFRGWYAPPTDAELAALSRLLGSADYKQVRQWLSRMHIVNNHSVTHQFASPEHAKILSGGSIVLEVILGWMIDPGKEIHLRETQRQAQNAENASF